MDGEGYKPKEEEVGDKQPGIEFDEYGQIKGGLSTPGESKPFVDPDDLPENKGRNAADSLKALRDRINNSSRVELDSQGEIVQLDSDKS